MRHLQAQDDTEFFCSLTYSMNACEIQGKNDGYFDSQDKFLEFSELQHPIVLQIGGSDVSMLAKATRLASTYGYDEINLK